jgi:hypothetical protein
MSVAASPRRFDQTWIDDTRAPYLASRRGNCTVHRFTQAADYRGMCVRYRTATSLGI